MDTWRDIIEHAYLSRVDAKGTLSKPEFNSPATTSQIEKAEEALGVFFPGELKSLLLESDGVMDMLSVDGQYFFESLWLIWPLEMMLAENQRYRDHVAKGGGNADSHGLLFFASAGTDGILFGLRLSPRGQSSCPVVAWYPMRNNATTVADSLAGYVTGWLQNQILV